MTLACPGAQLHTRTRVGAYYDAYVLVEDQTPSETQPGAASVRVVSGDGTVTDGSLTLVTVAPGLFSANASGEGVAAASVVRVKPDGTQSSTTIA